MTATEVTQATPAEGAASASTSKESSPSKAKETSPVKTKTPEQIKAEADTLIAVGKRDLLLNNVPDAVSNLAQACELLSKQFGETAKECAEVYFYYGKGLLELSRMESGVLGNALDGVPEEESENNTSQFEDPSKMSDQEKNEVTDNVSEALEENFKDLEEKKKATEEKKDGEKGSEEKMDVEKSTEKSSEEKMEEGKEKEVTKDDKEKKSEEVAKDEKKTDDAPRDGEKKAEDDEAIKDKAESSKDKEGEEKDEDEAMEEGTEDEEADGEESADEKKDETTDEKKDEEEEPSNLQLAWEMLELAKVVYTKQLETAEEADKSHLLERLCSTMLALGEVSIENENYKQAVEDIQECLKKEETMPKDARIIAETHYQLGVAQGFHAQHDEAVESLKSAIKIIQERITNMEKVETEEAKKEVTELKALVPEIEEKIKDTQDMKKEAETKKEEGAASSGDAFGSSKVAEVKPVSSIAVKRKAEDEESSNKKIAADKETAAAS